MNIKVYRKKRRSRVAFSILLSVIILSGVVVGSLAITPLSVYALPPALIKARTLGELILTLLAGAGTAVTSPTVVPAIYSNYSSPTYSFESMLQNGIITCEDSSLSLQEQIDAIGSGHTAYDLDVNGFRELVTSNWQTMRDLQLDTVFRINDLANADPTYGAIDNIGQIVKNIANQGYFGLENTVAVIANPGTTAQFGLGQLKTAFENVFGEYIENNIGISGTTGMSQAALTKFNQLAAAGGKIGFFKTQEGINGDFAYANTNSKQTKLYLFAYKNGNDLMANKIGLKNFGATCSYGFNNIGAGYGGSLYANEKKIINVQRTNSNPALIAENIYQGWSFYIKPDGSPYTTDEMMAIMTADDVINVPYKDAVNAEQGNINNLQNLNPSINNNDRMTIIPQEDYNNFVDEANQNYDNGIADENGLLLQDLINENMYVEPPKPVIPDQPNIPEKPEVTPEQIQQSLELTTQGLEDVFPFCIPFDLVKVVEGLEDERQAPHIVWSIDSEIFGHLGTIDLDLSVYDGVAEVCRILELILFIVGLMLITNNLIGRGG